jgi:hypothetical protein
MVRFLKTFGTFWCKLMHDQTTWPVSGKYYCGKCWRMYGVPWANARCGAVLVLPLPAKNRLSANPSMSRSAVSIYRQLDVSGVELGAIPAAER